MKSNFRMKSNFEIQHALTLYRSNFEKIVKKIIYSVFSFVYRSNNSFSTKNQHDYFSAFSTLIFSNSKFLLIFFSLTLIGHSCHMATKYLKRIPLPWLCHTKNLICFAIEGTLYLGNEPDSHVYNFQLKLHQLS